LKIVDLTHVIKEDMPVYPGTERPSLTSANTYEEDGFKETILHMYSHTGTHMDAPAHVKPDGKTLDAFHASQFVGKAVVIDCHDLSAGGRVDMSYINKQKKEVDESDFILFSSGWSRYWGTDNYYGDFPVPDQEVLQYLVDTQKKGIGMDAISIEPISEETLPHHHLVLGSGMVIIENLTNLEQMGNEVFTLAVLPLKWKDADGAPIRAVGILQK